MRRTMQGEQRAFKPKILQENGILSMRPQNYCASRKAEYFLPQLRYLLFRHYEGKYEIL